jgi:hypothetical protein
VLVLEITLLPRNFVRGENIKKWKEKGRSREGPIRDMMKDK